MRSPRPRDALIAAALVAAACSPVRPPEPAPPAPPPEPAAIVLDLAEIRAIAQVLRIEDRREPFDRAHAALLRHPNPEVRSRAILAAGRVGSAEALPTLAAALRDTSLAVRADAAFAIGLLRDSSRLAVDALEGALRATLVALREPGAPDSAAAGASVGHRVDAEHAAGSPPRTAPSDLAVAIEAVAALARIGSAAARAPVERVLAEGRTAEAEAGVASGRVDDRQPVARQMPSGVLGEALLVIWRFPRRPATVSLVLPYLREADVELRWRAAYALMRMADPGSVTALIRALREDEDALVRVHAARGLRAQVADSAAAAPAALHALHAALDDAHPHVRVNALRALATFERRAPVHAVAERTHDPDPNVALAAAEALGGIGGVVAVRALDAMSRDALARPALRAAALAALVRADPAAGVARAADLARSDHWLARLYAARAAGAASWALADSLLGGLVSDPDPRVAAAAMSAVARTAADTISAAHAFFIQGLASRDVGVRAAALRGLERRADPADLAVVLEAYDRAQHDAENDAALSAIDALAALAGKGMPVARSFFLRFSPARDPIVHARVDDRLSGGDWGEVRPIATAREPAFYEEVVRRFVAPILAGEPPPRVAVHTAGGGFVIELAAAEAPLTVHNFLNLVRQGFFDNGRWHRVVPNFVLQDGDPRGDGAGGPGYAIRDELNRIRYGRGTVGMALSGPDTGGSQFFVTHSPQPHLDGGYTVFGRVVDGMEVAGGVVQDDPIDAIRMVPR